MLFAGTLRDNITMGAAAGRRCRHAARGRARRGRGLRRPPSDGLRPARGRARRRRCRAGSVRRWRSPGRLLGDPPILVLDEPTSAMDNAGESRSEGPPHRRAGRPDAAAGHASRVAALSLVDRLIVLDGGKVVADGPKDQVLKALAAGQIAERSDGVAQPRRPARAGTAQGRQGSRAGVHARRRPPPIISGRAGSAMSCWSRSPPSSSCS